jgi:hypothetical protein
MLEPIEVIKREPRTRFLGNLISNYGDAIAMAVSAAAFQDPEHFGSLAHLIQYGGLVYGIARPIGDLFNPEADATGRLMHSGLRLARNILILGMGNVVSQDGLTLGRKIKDLASIGGLASLIEYIRLKTAYNEYGDCLLDKYRNPEPLSK